jgi:N-methylhydantoinase B
VSSFHGIHPDDGRFFIGSLGPLGGGWGAKRSEDGVSVTVCINDGDTHNSPAEQVESKYPVIVERYELRRDSGGAGRQRGGLGAELVVQARSPLSVTTTIERQHCRPWGLEGGGEAMGNEVAVRENGVWDESLPNAKLRTRRIKPGDAFRTRSGGGGGFGNPFARDPVRVAADVAEGYVSAERAATDYGVVLNSAGAVDAEATRRARERVRTDAAE